MNTKYYEDDDILVQRFSDNPIAREVSQDWNVNISYDKDGNIVQIVILEAKSTKPAMISAIADVTSALPDAKLIKAFPDSAFGMLKSERPTIPADFDPADLLAKS